MRWWWALAVLAAAAPLPLGSQAQAPTEAAEPAFTIDAVEALTGPYVPGAVPRAVALRWTYTWPAAVAEAMAGQRAILHWEPPVCDEGVLATWDSSEEVPLGNATALEHVVHATTVVHIGVGDGASGEVSLRCGFAGAVTTDRPPTRTRTSYANATIVPRYVGLVAAEAPVRLLEGGPGDHLRYELRLANFGNAPSLVRFGATVDDPAWEVIAPDPLVLRTNAAGQAVAWTTVVVVAVPPPDQAEATDGQATLRVRVTSSSLLSPDLHGNEVTVTLLGRASGCQAACQGIFGIASGMGVALLACGAIALAAVRWRRAR